MSKEKPVQVTEAQMNGDKEALSRMGRVGASHKIQLEDLRKAEALKRAINAKRKEIEAAKLGSLSEDRDVLPPDPKFLEELEEQLRDLSKSSEGSEV